jgi:YVTN family beta-propeller protein
MNTKRNNHSKILLRIFLFFALLVCYGFSATLVRAAPFLYVADDGSGTVEVVDLANNEVVAVIPVIGERPYGIAITPDGHYAYVANRDSGLVTVIDTMSNTVINNIEVGGEPYWVAVTPDGRHV